MKKFFILFTTISLILLGGCTKKENEEAKNKPIENNSIKVDQEKQNIIDSLTYLNNSNYDFNFKIVMYNNDEELNYNYKGTTFDDIKSVKANLNNKDYNYQEENNICYDLSNKNIIDNPLYEVNIAYTDFNNLIDLINKDNVKCLNYTCQFTTQNQEINLTFKNEIDDNYSISIQEKDTDFNNISTYELTYKNINKTKIIKSLNNYVRFNISFDNSNKINNKENIFFYKIDNVKYTLNNIESNLELYNYENDFIIFIKETNNKKEVYVSTQNYNNEILNILI